ncbi:MAG: hypothetical protein QXS93_03410 [Candidatus Micrarchaeia archaeon]
MMPSEIRITLGKMDQLSQYKLKLEVSKKFGNDGLKIYNLLEKSTDFELLRKGAGLDDDRLYRILAFMARVGLISVEGLPKKYLEESPITEGLVVGVAPAESLMRFRHQKALFKEFSSDGIKVYEYIRSTESTFDRISRDLGIEPEKVKEILDFMISNGIAYSKQVSPAKAPEKELEKPKETIEEAALPKAKVEEKISLETKKPPAQPSGREMAKAAQPPETIQEFRSEKAIDESAEYRIADLPLAERYNIQKEMLDKFGADGLKVYSLFTIPSTVAKVVELSGISRERVIEIAGKMLEKKYLTTKEKVITGEEKQLAERTTKKEEAMPEVPKEKTIVEEKKIEIKPVELEKEKEERRVETKEKTKPLKYEEKEEEIKPVELEEGEKLPEIEEEITQPETEEKEELPAEEEEEIQPPEEEVEEKPAGEKGEEEIQLPEIEEEITAPEITEEESEENKAPAKEELSQFEKIIKDEYGSKGLLVYRLIDGKRTAEEIMKEANVDEEFIIEFFGFLENRGIIRLEKPKGEQVKEEIETEEKMPISESFAAQPLTENIKVPKKEIIILDVIPLDVPILQKMPLPARMSLEAKLLAKFGPRALRILNRIDNESDIVKIAIENAIDLDELDEILYAISNSGGCTFATLSEDDIKRRYGDEALKIYKKYGREGVIIYELIGKMDSLKKMVSFAKVDPKKAVEIIVDINELLGIEGVTKKDLYAELGLRE